MNDVLRIGIGGPVGSGKTALIEALVPELIERGYSPAVITDGSDGTYPNVDTLLFEAGRDGVTFSQMLVDVFVFVLDTADGHKIPRKWGSGITESDLLIINKVDIAKYVGCDITVMEVEAHRVRGGRAVVLTDCLSGFGLDEFADFLETRRAAAAASAS